MSAALEPGMWVEVVKTAPNAAAFLGRVFRVSEVGVHRGEPFVNLHGWPKPPHFPGWNAICFRPIYRPSADFIQSLKAPPIRQREDA